MSLPAPFDGAGELDRYAALPLPVRMAWCADELARSASELTKVGGPDEIVLASKGTALMASTMRSALAELARLRGERQGELRCACAWAMAFGFATGHADTLADLLGEVTWQVQEIRSERDAARKKLAAAERIVEEIGRCEMVHDDPTGFVHVRIPRDLWAETYTERAGKPESCA